MVRWGICIEDYDDGFYGKGITTLRSDILPAYWYSTLSEIDMYDSMIKLMVF